MPPDELGRYDQRAEAAARVHAPTPCSARPAPHALPPDELGRVAQSESHTDCAIGNLIFVSFDNLDHDRRWAPFQLGRVPAKLSRVRRGRTVCDSDRATRPSSTESAEQGVRPFKGPVTHAHVRGGGGGRAQQHGDVPALGVQDAHAAQGGGAEEEAKALRRRAAELEVCGRGGGGVPGRTTRGAVA